MALVFDATPAGAAANSYVSEAAAAAYFDGCQDADAWLNASPGARQRVLVAATTRLDRMSWLGERSTTTQRLEWPRDGEEIMRWLEEATCELTLVLLRASPLDLLAGDELDGVESLSIGPLSLTKASTPPADSDLPPSVRRLIARWLAAGAGTFRVVRA